MEDPNNVETEFDVGECVFQADTLAIDSTATPTRACYERILKEVNVRTDSFWETSKWIHVVITFEGSSIKIYKDKNLFKHLEIESCRS